jgi:hypothetical protein
MKIIFTVSSIIQRHTIDWLFLVNTIVRFVFQLIEKKMTSAIICRATRHNHPIFFYVIRNSSSSSSASASQSTIRWKRLACQISGGLFTAGALGYAWAYSQAVHASGNKAHLVSLPWSFRGPFDSLDHASVRRGFEVYKQVCAACHSMKFLAYRHLVGVTHTEEEVKALAAQDQITDGPDDQGNMFQRPGKLTDYMPAPYPNDKVCCYFSRLVIRRMCFV